MLAIYLGLLFAGVALFVLSYVAPFRVAALMRLRYPQHWQVVTESAKGRTGPLQTWMRMQYVLRSPALPALQDRDIDRWRGIWRYSQWLGWLCWLAALAMRLRWGLTGAHDHGATSMQLQLDGRHALVCGASQGIGRASAIELAALGANVTLLARRAEVLEALASELPRTHAAQRHDYLAVDVGDTAALSARAEALVAVSPAHILVNNSGGPPPGSVLDANPEDFLAAWRQHLLACHTLAQVVVPGMRAVGWGRIVNVISTSVREPIPGIGVSNTTRGAVASWAKTLAGELAPFGITVNNVLPGSTRTPRIEQIVAARAQKSGKPPAEVQQAMEAEVPMRRFAEPAEIAAAIAFLASPAAGYITGVSLPVDGGRMRSL